MGIRVDEDSIVSQCKICGNEDRLTLPYHRDIIEKNLPYTIGGGIGQSRICMYFLEKKHIGEVQVGVWDELTRQQAKKDGIILL